MNDLSSSIYAIDRLIYKSHEKSRSRSVNHDQRSPKCSRAFSEHILFLLRNNGSDKPRFRSKDATGEEQSCSLRSARLMRIHERKRTCPGLFSCFAFFSATLLSAAASVDVDRRSYTLERRSGEDCCHYCDARPRGPSKYATHTHTYLSRVRAHVQASERANA